MDNKIPKKYSTLKTLQSSGYRGETMTKGFQDQSPREAIFMCRYVHKMTKLKSKSTLKTQISKTLFLHELDDLAKKNFQIFFLKYS